jgi:hypothetical protein
VFNLLKPFDDFNKCALVADEEGCCKFEDEAAPDDEAAPEDSDIKLILFLLIILLYI